MHYITQKQYDSLNDTEKELLLKWCALPHNTREPKISIDSIITITRKHKGKSDLLIGQYNDIKDLFWKQLKLVLNMNLMKNNGHS